MDLDEQLLVQRLLARVGELEGWLGLLVAGHGIKNGNGFRYTLCADHALDIRRRLSSDEPAVAIEYDFDRDRHIIDVL